MPLAETAAIMTAITVVSTAMGIAIAVQVGATAWDTITIAAGITDRSFRRQTLHPVRRSLPVCVPEALCKN